MRIFEPGGFVPRYREDVFWKMTNPSADSQIYPHIAAVFNTAWWVGRPVFFDLVDDYDDGMRWHVW
jgi:hypothetical protein